MPKVGCKISVILEKFFPTYKKWVVGDIFLWETIRPEGGEKVGRSVR